MPQDLTDDKSTLVQVMAWYREATSHYLNQCWPRSPTPYGVTRPQWVNSLRSSDVIWPYSSGSTLAQVMACSLMAPSHYLNQCWLIINEALWHSREGNFTGNAHYIYPWYEFENFLIMITAAPPALRGHWVNTQKYIEKCWHLVEASKCISKYFITYFLFLGLKICGVDCLLSCEWKSPNKIIARTGDAKGKGDIVVVTASGGIGTSTVQFRGYKVQTGMVVIKSGTILMHI